MESSGPCSVRCELRSESKETVLLTRTLSTTSVIIKRKGSTYRRVNENRPLCRRGRFSLTPNGVSRTVSRGRKVRLGVCGDLHCKERASLGVKGDSSVDSHALDGQCHNQTERLHTTASQRKPSPSTQGKRPC